MSDDALSEVAAAVALIAAGGQLLAARWRDVGVLTLCAVAASLAFARGFPSPVAAAALLGAAVVAALGWARGARHGVGRPGLFGLGLAAVALGALAPFLVPDGAPPEPRERLIRGALVAIGLCAAVGSSLALERPGPRRVRPILLRRVPVTAAAPADPPPDDDRSER